MVATNAQRKPQRGQKVHHRHLIYHNKEDEIAGSPAPGNLTVADPTTPIANISIGKPFPLHNLANNQQQHFTTTAILWSGSTIRSNSNSAPPQAASPPFHGQQYSSSSRDQSIRPRPASAASEENAATKKSVATENPLQK
ncbi:hypothetical protein Nepgr_023114 [Nepenthes gracilis]|uniref:Uncharacterized protein n=1 Tax=Nepenthes gracilis TaxID=150966 RepID=A0AAD3T3A0_NEPGR|nr:hypothetical protein Nepgr_023114 [Nepenthes gracilis]